MAILMVPLHPVCVCVAFETYWIALIAESEAASFGGTPTEHVNWARF